jgi:hypothetical protein
MKSVGNVAIRVGEAAKKSNRNFTRQRQFAFAFRPLLGLLFAVAAV